MLTFNKYNESLFFLYFDLLPFPFSELENLQRNGEKVFGMLQNYALFQAENLSANMFLGKL